MIAVLEPLLPPIFAITAGLYLGLAVYVWRSSPQSIIAFFLLLIGTMIAGSAFSYGTQDPNLYGIGRTLSFFAGSFMPVAMFLVYRQYTDSPAGTLTIAILSIIPIATTGLASAAWSCCATPRPASPGICR